MSGKTVETFVSDPRPVSGETDEDSRLVLLHGRRNFLAAFSGLILGEPVLKNPCLAPALGDDFAGNPWLTRV
ncbi:MAG: hypothetical protein LBH31_00760, partial [Burkholderiaceae bacterium]|nr:hypothetical protein [Burkholderiaceae bacterium]